ncbi:ADP dependent glucokinase [Trichuris trichiura]|uniref:ADP dependent glucokinase n=1 Tax=Trichuris trichiura TaxID=36087 RepID=A0A077Z9F1_TRITR|nr:ADP dependent glucokinase [Trichuris trichiura]
MTLCSPNRLLIAGFIAAAISYMYGIYKQRDRKQILFMEETLVSSWQKMMQVPSVKFSKILVGFNSDVDLIVSGTKLLTDLNVMPSIAASHHDISTIQQLEEVFSLSFSRGLPAERYVSDPDLFTDLVNQADNKASSSEAAIGGNAALIANNIASKFERVKVLLVGPIGPKLKALLHPGVSMQNSTIIPRDEIHLIMEFRYGETWGDYVAPGYSRFITSHDYFSGSSIVIDMLFNTIPLFRPDLIVLSGVHLLEFQPTELWLEKLTLIKRHLNQAKRKTPIHLELGHMSNVTFVKKFMTKVLPFVDSLTLSEQELMILSHVGGGPYADHFPMKSITIHPHKATEILNWLLLHYGPGGDSTSKQRYYRLRRVHVHSLTFHMLASRGPDWSNGAASLAAGALAAAEEACGTVREPLSAKSLELRINEVHMVDKTMERKYRFNALNPIHSWMREDVLFIYTPVLLCRHPAKTVGVAQAVDAAALMYSQFFKLNE